MSSATTSIGLAPAEVRVARAPIRWGRVTVHIVVFAIAAAYLAPLLVVVINSVRTSADIGQHGVIGLPHSFSPSNFATAWSGYCIAQHCSGIKPYLMNSLLMAIPATLLSTALGAVCGYAISLWRFRGDAWAVTGAQR